MADYFCKICGIQLHLAVKVLFYIERMISTWRKEYEKAFYGRGTEFDHVYSECSTGGVEYLTSAGAGNIAVAETADRGGNRSREQW